MTNPNISQPLERQNKEILVSLYTNKGLIWALIPALKVGNKYKVASKQLNHILEKTYHEHKLLFSR
jgi:hypothetical protein